MKSWNVTDPTTGKRLKITSPDDTPPSEQELSDIFDEQGSAPQESLIPSPSRMLADVTAPKLRPMGVFPEQLASDFGGDVYGKLRNRMVGMIPENVKTGLGKATRSLIPGGNVLPLNSLDKPLGNMAAGVGVDIGTGAATDIATATLPKAAASVAKDVGQTAENVGGRLMNFYIKPRQAGYKFGSNPGRGVIKHVGPQMTREGLLQGINNAKDRLLSQLEESAANSQTPVDATPIFQEIAGTVNKMKDLPETYAGQIDAHRALARDLMRKVSKNGFIKDGKIYVYPKDAIQIKRAIGELPSWATNDPKLGTLTKTSRKAYGAFDKEIDKAVPGSATTNRDVSDLIGAQKGIELGMQREQNKSPLGLIDLAVGGLTGSHSGPAGFIPGALASKAVRSAPFNTTVGAGFAGVGRAGRSASTLLEAANKPSLIAEALRRLRTGKALAVRA